MQFLVSPVSEPPPGRFGGGGVHRTGGVGRQPPLIFNYLLKTAKCRNIFILLPFEFRQVDLSISYENAPGIFMRQSCFLEAS